jgi:hypothetical protein
MDRLFDKGYITFDSDGSVITSSTISDDDYAKCGLDADMNVGKFTVEQEAYLDYHRYFVFLI